MQVFISTLGCPKNAIDSEGLAGLLTAGGHEVIDRPDSAEVILVNTCGFIDPARRETIQEALDLADYKETGNARGLILTGCLVARAADELADALPEVDAFVDFAAYPRVSEIVEQTGSGTLQTRVHGTPGTRFDPAWWDASIASAPRLRFGRSPWAYVKIAEGCDRGCTFCAIPLMRGKFRSRDSDTIADEVTRLAAQGVSEFSLVSQDSVMWGRDTGEGDLLALLDRLEGIDGVRRIRLMYLHPQGVTDALIDRILSSEIVAHYFDLSLQHVAPGILKGMGRWGGRERFERMIDRIRTADPLAGVRATFILGFPGETDTDATEVESFVADSDLDWIGTFTYSPEEGTRSFAFEDRVEESTARERAERVQGLADLAMERRARSLAGARLTTLAERFDLEQQAWVGRSHREAPEVDGEVRFTSDGAVSVGEYLEVSITGNEGADLLGKHEIS